MGKAGLSARSSLSFSFTWPCSWKGHEGSGKPGMTFSCATFHLTLSVKLGPRCWKAEAEHKHVTMGLPRRVNCESGHFDMRSLRQQCTHAGSCPQNVVIFASRVWLDIPALSCAMRTFSHVQMHAISQLLYARAGSWHFHILKNYEYSGEVS